MENGTTEYLLVCELAEMKGIAIDKSRMYDYLIN